MTFWNRIYKPALVMLAALLFVVVGQMQSQLNDDRKNMGITKMDPLQNAPPVLAFTTVALGGFRGLIANTLWMRLSDLQEQDKYFEMVQLADWITVLQPRMVGVWLFQAWNMAYNISVKFKSHEDRWRWVERGIELLRDEGLKYNPHETQIYQQISWIYQHKIGANLDDAHMLYKLRWAQEMQGLLGHHPNFPELFNPTTPEAKEKLRVITEVYKLDPKIIQQVETNYGPFDWRLPDAQAVYWAEMGRIYGRPELQEQLRRSIYQSLQQMIFRGGALDKSITNVTAENFMLWPNLDQVETVSKEYELMLGEELAHPNGLEQNIKNAHKNFLKQSIYLLYEAGRTQEAKRWYDYVKKLYATAFVGPEAGLSLEDYCIRSIIDDNNDTDQNKVEASILAMYEQMFYCLVRDNDDQAANYNNLAGSIWRHYETKTAGASRERIALKPIAQLKKFVLDRMLDPETGLPRTSPQAAAMLRTKLNLPAPKPVPAAGSTTNAPAAS